MRSDTPRQSIDPATASPTALLEPAVAGSEPRSPLRFKPTAGSFNE